MMKQCNTTPKLTYTRTALQTHTNTHCLCYNVDEPWCKRIWLVVLITCVNALRVYPCLL